jgi:hypothetical protein
VLLHIVYSFADLIRLAALTTEAPRPKLLRDFQGMFSEQLAALGGSPSGLEQWKTTTERWARDASRQASLIDAN